MGSRSNIVVWKNLGTEENPCWNWRIDDENEAIVALGRPQGYDTEYECLSACFRVFFGSYDLSYLAAYRRWAELAGGTPTDDDGQPLDVYVREADKEQQMFRAVPEDQIKEGPMPEVEVAPDFAPPSQIEREVATNLFANATTPRMLLAMLAGYSSGCWVGGTGDLQFDSSKASAAVDATIERLAEMEISL